MEFPRSQTASQDTLRLSAMACGDLPVSTTALALIQAMKRSNLGYLRANLLPKYVYKYLTLTALFLCALDGWALDPDALECGDIGHPAIAGSYTNRNGCVEMTGSGAGIKLTADEFFYAATPEPGDFDVRVLVVGLKNTDIWTKAGLMLREGRSVGARFGAVFTTPSGAGSLFQSRNATGSTAVNDGSFRANQPFAWLRLKRQGNVITGYAGYDGLKWTILGTKSISFDTNTLLGLAVTSHGTNATTALFQNLGPTESTVVEQVAVEGEPIGPSSRRTALVISEIMYHPAARSDGRNLEFIELYNSQPYFEDIGGWKITGEIEYTFPAGTIIPGGGFVVVAAAPADVQAVYGLDYVHGPYEGRLSNSGGTVRLVGDHKAVYLDIKYGDQSPWPLMADGAGHSLVLSRPSYGEGNPHAWAASRIKGGSPGMPEAVEITSTMGIRINEVQLPTSEGEGFVEIFNKSSAEADLSGLHLGVSPTSLPYAIAQGTKLPAGGFLHFTWTQMGFALSQAGGDLYLESADSTRFLDAVRVPPQMPGLTTGRWPNGGDALRTLTQATPGAANARPNVSIVINEINATPLSGDDDEEFVELFNAGSVPVDLSGWRFTSGIDYTFPMGTRLANGDYLVVARNTARFQQVYSNLPIESVLGDYKGKLSGRGESLELSQPMMITNPATGGSETVMAPVSSATYGEGGRWSKWSDGGGSSLELIDPRADTSLAANWVDSDESKRGEWTVVEATGVLDNSPVSGGFGGWPGGGSSTVSPDALHITMLGEGECLVDNVEVIGQGRTNRVANSTFESNLTGWTCVGNHIRSSLETNEGWQSAKSLHIRASNNGDTGPNKVSVKLTTALKTNDTVTLRARVKWLHGWPEVLLRLRGNYLEAYGRLNIPGGGGTPGHLNHTVGTNTGPAIGEVTHFPVVPNGGESVVVSARVDDPDGVQSVVLRYRMDPSTNWTTVPMLDDGTTGDAVPNDGVFSGLLPVVAAGKTLAFTIEAQDRVGALRMFPPGAPTRECLVRYGEGVTSGAFGTYRLWLTQANANIWQNRPNLSNEPVESTFVYGHWRAVYNAGGRYAGSPFHQAFSTLASDAHYVFEVPKDDRVLGTTAFNKVHAPGNSPFDDGTLQREQSVYWLARKMGMPWLYRRYVNVYFNGTKRKTLMEDTQVGTSDFVEEFWNDDADGNLFKMQPWFEFTDGTAQSLSFSQQSWCTLQKYTDSKNQHKLRRYRWNWLVRGANGTANDYTNVFALMDTLAATTSTNYASMVTNLVDVDEWMRFFAINHAVGNWDSIGYKNAQNTYSYKPRDGRWELVIWDANIALGGANSDSATSLTPLTSTDPTFGKWVAQGSVFRRHILTAYYDLVNGPMTTNAISSMLDAKYAAFQEHGISAQSPSSIKTYVANARKTILTQITKESAAFSITNIVATNSIILGGTGPLDMVTLEVNGVAVPVTWTTSSRWMASIPTEGLADSLLIRALNSSGETVAQGSQNIVRSSLGRLSLQPNGENVLLEYQVRKMGVHYLEAATNLLAPDWQTVTQQNAVVGTKQFTIPAPVDAPTFYRVRAPQ